MIYDKVKALCEEQGISIRECEKRAGLGNATIAGWKTNEPKLWTINAVAKALGVPLSTFTEDSNEKNG